MPDRSSCIACATASRVKGQERIKKTSATVMTTSSETPAISTSRRCCGLWGIDDGACSRASKVATCSWDRVGIDSTRSTMFSNDRHARCRRLLIVPMRRCAWHRSRAGNLRREECALLHYVHDSLVCHFSLFSRVQLPRAIERRCMLYRDSDQGCR